MEYKHVLMLICFNIFFKFSCDAKYAKLFDWELIQQGENKNN